jgi:hypothetical protein
MSPLLWPSIAPPITNAKHGQQRINTLRVYAFPKIGRMPVDSIGQPEVLMCLSPIWTDKHETAKRLSQRIKTVLDVAKSKGFRSGENPVIEIRDARVLPQVKWSGKFGQRAKMYPTRTNGYENDKTTELFRPV